MVVVKRCLNRAHVRLAALCFIPKGIMKMTANAFVAVPAAQSSL